MAIIGNSAAVLLFAQEESIKAINLHDHNKSVLFDHLGGVFSFDFDYHSNIVCIYCSILLHIRKVTQSKWSKLQVLFIRNVHKCHLNGR